MRFAVLCLAVAASGVASSQTTYHVEPGGNDGNPGTQAQPWQTISRAAGGSEVGAGDIVIVHEGTYHERVRIERSGAAGHPVVFREASGETAVIDGTGLEPNYEGLVTIVDQSHVVVEGFEIRNFATQLDDVEAIGIYVAGASKGITVRGNTIHDIVADAPDIERSNALGILVWGTESEPIRDLLIEDNELYDLTLGNSEALTVKCNVDGFRVIRNYVHDVDNIGIDIVGNEDCEVPARNGVVRGNHIERASSCLPSRPNPAYSGCASGGIYVDGGADVTIEQNIVEEADLGIELGAENTEGQPTRRVLVRNNVVRGGKLGGIGIGTDPSAGASGAEDCIVVGNTVVGTTGDGALYIQEKVTGTVVANNIFFPAAGVAVVAKGTSPSQITFSHNLYFDPDGRVEWEWENHTYTSLSAWESSTGEEGAVSADPRFVAATSVPDRLHLQAESPAIDAGDPSPCSAPCIGTVDADGQSRVFNGIVDIGAYEFSGPTAISEPSYRGRSVVLSPRSALPTSGGVTVSLYVVSPQDVQVDVVDALGRRVALLFEGWQSGTREIRWDGGAAGVYWLRASGNHESTVLPVTVVR